MLALDAVTGKTVWDREVFRQVPRKKETRNSYSTPTPVTDGKRVYAVFSDGGFAALDFAGNIAWTNRDYPFYSQHGLGASPVLSGGLLIMTMDASSEGEDKLIGWQKPWDKSFVVALDAATGKQTWAKRLGGNFSASPILAGGHIYCCSEQGETHIIKPGMKPKVVGVNKLARPFGHSILC